MTCLPRRPIPSIRRPATPATKASGSSSRSVRVHATRAPVITGPGPAIGQQAAPEVARDGLDLGELRHRSDDRTRPAAVRRTADARTSGTMGRSMTPPIDAARARRARIAVSTLFFAHGAIAAAVLPRLPAIKDNLGLTNAELGAPSPRSRSAACSRAASPARSSRGLGSARGRGHLGRRRVHSRSPSIGLASSWAMLVAAVPRARHVRRHDGRGDEHPQPRRAAGVRALDPAALPRLWSVGGMAAGARPRHRRGRSRSRSRRIWRMAVVIGRPPSWPHTGSSCRPPSRTRTGDRRRAPTSPSTSAMPAGCSGSSFPIAMLGILCIVLQSTASIWARSTSPTCSGWRRDRRRRLRRVHHRDGDRPADERPLGRPLGRHGRRPRRCRDRRRAGVAAAMLAGSRACRCSRSSGSRRSGTAPRRCSR